MTDHPQDKEQTPEAARQAFLDRLSEGLSVKKAALQVGVARSTLYGWRQADAAFADAWAKAEEKRTSALEREAIRRAVEGIEKPVYRGGEIVGHIREYSDSMLMFLLKAKHPDIYGTGRERDGDNGEDSFTAADIEGAKHTLQRKFHQIMAAGKTEAVSQ